MALEAAFDVPPRLAVPPQHQPHHLVTLEAGRRGHGTFKLSGGTGAYAKISGAGTYKLNILAVAAKNAAGKCSQKAPPTAFQQIVKATGKVSL